MLGVLHLGMELDPVEGTVDAGDGLDATGRRGGGDPEAGGYGLHLVVVAAPRDEFVGEAPEEVGVVGDLQLDLAELRSIGGTDLGAETLAHELHAGADAEDGVLRAIDVFRAVAHPAPVAGDVRGPAGEDQAV